MRFLIVRIAALGDIVMSTPLLSRIRAQYPDAHVTWLCGARARTLVEAFPGVDEIITVDEEAVFRGGLVARTAAFWRLWANLRRRGFDRILMLHPDRRYRLLTLPLLRTPMTSASLRPGPQTNPIRGRYRGDEAARLLDAEGWSGPQDRRYLLADVRSRIPVRRRDAARPRIVMVPGGARNVLRENARRRWSVAAYRQLAAALIDKGCDVVLLGDTSDISFGREFDGMRVENRIGTLSIPESLSELASADVVVTHDTGPLHLARLVRAPIVALFGPTDPREFVGPDSDITVIWGGEHLACRPCYDGRDYPPCADHVCMSGIGLPEVLAAVLQRTGLEPTGAVQPGAAAHLVAASPSLRK